ncbi:MAG: IclR family transcriptional regulator [Desulfobacterales bacterium]|nr:IclR family transcriptional regulator [Desulfobacterales bacterium]
MLACLYQANRPLALEEFVTLSGYKKTSCFRLLKTMLGLEILERGPNSKTYQFGPQLVSIGLAALKNMSLIKTALPVLQALRNETHETVNLSMRDGNEIVFVERLMSNYIVNPNINVGDRLPVYCASMGKAILAFMRAEHAEELIGQLNFQAKTKRTITTAAALKKELNEIRKNGVAINDEELEKGLRGVAAPIFNHTGEAFAAVNVVWTTARHPSRKMFDRFTPTVVAAAEKISARMGCGSNTSSPRSSGCAVSWGKSSGRKTRRRRTETDSGRRGASC